MLDDGLVKTTRFTKPKYVGDPINAIRIFSDKEVDELMVLDIGASRQAREPNYELIEQFAGECFMPLCYGGGIRSVEQARRLFALGVEKVCLQTAALEDMTLVTRIAEQFGSQSVLVSADVKANWLGKPKLYASKSGKLLDRPWLQFLQEAVAAGAGEVVLNSVDRDGTMLIVIANQGSKSHTENKAGLLRVDPNNGRAIETITFVDGSADPHGLEFHNGQLLSCDAGYHPSWKNFDSDVTVS